MKDRNTTEFNCLKWDESKISRFWNFIAQSEAHQGDYFTKQVGAGIFNFLRYTVSMKGRILDYGCGNGYLAEHFIAHGISCEGVDFSQASVDAVNEKFKSNPLWGGAKVYTGGRLPYPDDTFDLILATETIEHVLDSHLKGMLQELHRILKPKTGRLFITTPNSENLSQNMVFCPDCGAVFHRYQHLRSFTKSSLHELMITHGFKTQACNATCFNYFQEHLLKNPLDWSIRQLGRQVKKFGVVVQARMGMPHSTTGEFWFNLFIGNGNHLFWLGSKE